MAPKKKSDEEKNIFLLLTEKNVFELEHNKHHFLHIQFDSSDWINTTNPISILSPDMTVAIETFTMAGIIIKTTQIHRKSVYQLTVFFHLF